jgi:hypothetical protein
MQQQHQHGECEECVKARQHGDSCKNSTHAQAMLLLQHGDSNGSNKFGHIRVLVGSIGLNITSIKVCSSAARTASTFRWFTNVDICHCCVASVCVLTSLRYNICSITCASSMHVQRLCILMHSSLYDCCYICYYTHRSTYSMA